MQRANLPISRKGDGLKRALFLCDDNYLLGRYSEEIVLAVRALLDLVSGRLAVRDRGIASWAEAYGPSAKLGAGPISGKDHAYARSPHYADEASRALPRTS